MNITASSPTAAAVDSDNVAALVDKLKQDAKPHYTELGISCRGFNASFAVYKARTVPNYCSLPASQPFVHAKVAPSKFSQQQSQDVDLA